MNRERTRNGRPTSPLHKLVVAEAERARPSGRVLLLMSMALVAGVAAALLWLYQNPRGALEMLPDGIAQATEPAASPTESAATPAVSATAMAEVDDAPANLEAGSVEAANVGIAAASVRNLAAQSGPRQQEPPPPRPTATSTPLPFVDSVEAVVGIGGVQLWDGTTGQLMGQAEQGALFTATARSSDGQWLYGTLEDGSNGWARIDQLIVFDTARLRAEDVLIMPITPTPTSLPGEQVAADAPPAQAEAPTQPDDGIVLRPTPVAGEAPLARVTLQDSRLNLRAGPGSGYAIIAKAMPNEQFAVLGRDASSQWLQLSLPGVVGGFAWAAAEFLVIDGAIGTLPVTDAVSNAPTYQEGAEVSNEVSKGGQAVPQDAPRQPEAQDGLVKPVAPVPQPAAPQASATGLTGKLVIQTTWGGDIHLYNLETGELRLLTGGFDPALSPDGTQVAFTRIGGEHGLYLINIDGTNERLIFAERAAFYSPKWSPDGQYILFQRGDEVWNCTILPRDDPDPAGKCLVNLPPPNAEETQHQIARVDVNGENYQDIPALLRGRAPDWNSAGITYYSPAGIQKTQDAPGAKSELVYFNIRKQYELDPDWQPNGGRIIFQRRENDHWEIWSVAPDGSGLVALTYPKFTLVKKLPSNVAPAWSPDGQHIVFLSNRDLDNHNEGTEEWHVWVMNADGSNQRPLNIDLPFTYTFVAEQMLDWGR